MQPTAQPTDQPADDPRARVLAILQHHGIQASPEDVDMAISLLQEIMAQPDEGGDGAAPEEPDDGPALSQALRDSDEPIGPKLSQALHASQA